MIAPLLWPVRPGTEADDNDVYNARRWSQDIACDKTTRAADTGAPV